MKVKFLAPAEKELIDAVAYYNSQSEGLGFEFAAEVKRTALFIERAKIRFYSLGLVIPRNEESGVVWPRFLVPRNDKPSSG